MSWRNQDTHKAETKAVKDALTKAGINAYVGHGRGTAWGWLEINIGNRHANAGVNHGFEGYGCPLCVQSKDLETKARHIAREITGRDGEYDGEILILTQSHWDGKKSIPILQPGEVLVTETEAPE